MSVKTSPGRAKFLEVLAPASGEKVLDVGAGRGDVAEMVRQASHGAEVYAVDPNEKRVAAMRLDHPEVKGSVASAESLPFPDGYFDKAYATLALHHFSDLEKALGEIRRVLKRGGYFVVVEVEPHSWEGRVFRFFGKVMGERMNIMSQGELERRLGAVEGLALQNSVKLGQTYLIQTRRS
jgi:ubiquinone/menaquinone biosynthesis C-methylase UbiE